MILVDTSVWVDHIARADAGLIALLGKGSVVMHPFVLGEIALGNLRNRESVITALSDLPQVVAARDAEVVHVIAASSLFGVGIGYIDAHLLVSCMLSDVGLWTRDKRLDSVARRLGLTASSTSH